MKRAVLPWRNRRGVASLEFALMAPLTVLILVLVVDFGMALSAKLRLINATAGAAQVAFHQGDAAFADHGAFEQRLRTVARADSDMADLALTLRLNNASSAVDAQPRYCAVGYPAVITVAAGAQCADGTPPGRYLLIATAANSATLLGDNPIFGTLLPLAETAVVRLP